MVSQQTFLEEDLSILALFNKVLFQFTRRKPCKRSPKWSRNRSEIPDLQLVKQWAGHWLLGLWPIGMMVNTLKQLLKACISNQWLCFTLLSIQFIVFGLYLSVFKRDCFTGWQSSLFTQHKAEIISSCYNVTKFKKSYFNDQNLSNHDYFIRLSLVLLSCQEFSFHLLSSF
jgi:hypothetical protein